MYIHLDVSEKTLRINYINQKTRSFSLKKPIQDIPKRGDSQLIQTFEIKLETGIRYKFDPFHQINISRIICK